MNIIETAIPMLYRQDAGVRHMGMLGTVDQWQAYLVVGRTADSLLVVTGVGINEETAVEVLMRKLKVFREWQDLALHTAFWELHERREQETASALRKLFGAAPAAPKKPEEEPS